MKRLTVSPAARNDLRDIATFIAADSPEQALRFVAGLSAKMDMIAQQTLIYRSRDEWSAGLRSAQYGRYHILFRDLPDRVRVVRVIHSARNIAAMAHGGMFDR